MKEQGCFEQCRMWLAAVYKSLELLFLPTAAAHLLCSPSHVQCITLIALCHTHFSPACVLPTLLLPCCPRIIAGMHCEQSPTGLLANSFSSRLASDMPGNCQYSLAISLNVSNLVLFIRYLSVQHCASFKCIRFIFSPLMCCSGSRGACSLSSVFVFSIVCISSAYILCFQPLMCCSGSGGVVAWLYVCAAAHAWLVTKVAQALRQISQIRWAACLSSLPR